MNKTRTCSRGPSCLAGDPEQPLSQFKSDQRHGLTRMCAACRQRANEHGRRKRRRKPRPPVVIGGYGLRPARCFALAYHQYVLDIPHFHPWGLAYEEAGYFGFNLLRDPAGRPVARQHRDLRPGEVSLVLR